MHSEIGSLFLQEEVAASETPICNVQASLVLIKPTSSVTQISCKAPYPIGIAPHSRYLTVFWGHSIRFMAVAIHIRSCVSFEAAWLTEYGAA